MWVPIDQSTHIQYDDKTKAKYQVLKKDGLLFTSNKAIYKKARPKKASQAVEALGPSLGRPLR
jgi:hypothetical protein